MRAQPIHAAEIARFLDVELLGDDLSITGACSFEDIRPQCMLFDERSTPETWLRLANLPQNLILCREEMDVSLHGPHLCLPNPRLGFVLAARHFFCEPQQPFIHPTAAIDPQAVVGENVSVGAFTVIGPEVVVGDNTVIGNHVVLAGRTRVGRHCRLKSGCVIGEDGFGFVVDAEGRPHATPHFGGVAIGDYVWLGAVCTVERGMFDDTTIEDHVKVDDLAQVGHNCVVGRGARVAAGVILCGAARIGAGAWVAPNSNVLERRRVGEGSFIGLGSNVLSDVPDSATWAGNPARKLRQDG